jgi:3-methyladenine DNA glycosylase/8-oxoguanine DNA glycosylase
MVTAIVANLGDAAPGAPADGAAGRACPTPTAMAEAGEGFYRDVARAGYRGAYLIALARSVAEGELTSRPSRATPQNSRRRVEAQLLAPRRAVRGGTS